MDLNKHEILGRLHQLVMKIESLGCSTENTYAVILASALGEDLEKLVDTFRKRDWQPIETAPKDGSRFLAYERPEALWPDKILMYSCEWSGDCYVMSGPDCNYFMAPTHWMPLPEPPK